MKQKCRNVLKAYKASKNKHTIKSAACTIQSTTASLHIHAKQAKVPKINHCTAGHSRNWICGTNQLSVTVQTASATRDLLLIQRVLLNKQQIWGGRGCLHCYQLSMKVGQQWSMMRCSVKVFHTTSHHTSDHTLPQILSLSLTSTVTVTLTINDIVIPTVG